MEGSKASPHQQIWTQDLSLLASSSSTSFHPVHEGIALQGGGPMGTTATSSSEDLPSAAPKSAYMKYACPVCGKEYYNKADYRRHYMTHTGEKPFQCSLCPYRAARFYSLKTHVMARHGPDAMNLMATIPQE